MAAGDEADRRAQAVGVAAAGAVRFGISADAFRDSVESVQERIDRYQRARHVIEREHDVPVRTTCATCLGGGSHACTVCEGTLRAPCDECDGSGKVPGVRGMKNCPTCRGKADRRCTSCERGSVRCGTCTGSGNVSAGTRIETTRRTEVTVHPRDSVAARRHVSVESPGDFDADPSRWPARLERAGRVVNASELPSELRPSLGPRERIVSSEAQSFAASSYRIVYRAAFRTGHVIVEERPWRAVQGDQSPLLRRRAAGRLAFGGAALIALLVVTTFYFRDSWYVLFGFGSPLCVASIAFAFAARSAARGLTLHSRAWSVTRTWIPTIATFLLPVAMAFAFALPRPSVATAEAALAAGDLERAAIEARALAETDTDPVAADRLFDEVHLRRVRGGWSIADIAASVRQPWRAARYRAAAVRHLRETSTASAETYAQARDPRALVEIANQIRDVLPDVAADTHRRAVAIAAHLCAERRSFACAEDNVGQLAQLGGPPDEVLAVRERVGQVMHATLEAEQIGRGASPSVRVQSLQRALDTAQRYTRVTGRPSSPTVAEIEHDLGAARTAAAAEERRVAAERARQDARDARRDAEARRAEARSAPRRQAPVEAQQDERATLRRETRAAARQESQRSRSSRADAPLLCRDGTLSPTCTCGGPRRGCCSWHRGVAGCSE
ncbi:MAG: hypothetical protein IT379_39690 [Deltaproteobacteria bacterium]|nr:hypothetical protein [Deltaproteobacteria bacterium]